MTYKEDNQFIPVCYTYQEMEDDTSFRITISILRNDLDYYMCDICNWEKNQDMNISMYHMSPKEAHDLIRVMKNDLGDMIMNRDLYPIVLKNLEKQFGTV